LSVSTEGSRVAISTSVTVSVAVEVSVTIEFSAEAVHSGSSDLAGAGTSVTVEGVTMVSMLADSLGVSSPTWGVDSLCFSSSEMVCSGSCVV